MSKDKDKTMPQVEIPLRDDGEVRQLARDKQYRREADELVEITDQMKKLKDRADELRLSLHDRLRAALPEEEKSILHQYRMQDPKNPKVVHLVKYRLSVIQGEARSSFSKEKALKYMTAAQLAKCYVKGEKPRPTVSVTEIVEKG
jgi:hypothetical protein